jgi:spoIIIJ-associated protein
VKIIKADTLELAMEEATAHFECSVTELQIEVVEHPKSGMMGFFKKQAVIAVIKKTTEVPVAEAKEVKPPKPNTQTKNEKRADVKKATESKPVESKKTNKKPAAPKKSETQTFVSNHSDMLTPSLVTAQDDYDDVYDENEYKKSEPKSTSTRSKEEIQKSIAKAEEEASSIKRVSSTNFHDSDVVDEFFQESLGMDAIVSEVKSKINHLFSKTCFSLEEVAVSAYDETTILVEFTGADAALLIGKEGYRYKALSYMLFNWMNSKYSVQLRLEIAEFLKNQEEMVHKYLEGISDQVDKNGRAQTKILDGVLVQIALKKLRANFPDKYVAIRTNRDGLKYIIVNSFRSNNG